MHGIHGDAIAFAAELVDFPRVLLRPTSRIARRPPFLRVACCYPSDLDTIPEGQGAERATVWRKEGYHDDYTKSPILPDDRDDITEYVELLAMLHSPRESFARAYYVVRSKSR